MTFDEFADGILKFGGISSYPLRMSLETHSFDSRFSLFKAITSPADFSLRALYIFTAPFVFAIACVACAALALFSLILSPLEAIIGDTDDAKQSFGDSITFFLYSAACLLGILFSPILNTIELVASGINTCLPQHEWEYPLNN